MSIRYTLRHNIPSSLIEKEDVNDSSTWDLNLLRKHEIAETDNHDIVYRQHNGEIVNWAQGATQRATAILESVKEMKEYIEGVVGMPEESLREVSEILHNAQAIIQGIEYIQEHKDQLDFLKHFRIVEGHLCQVMGEE